MQGMWRRWDEAPEYFWETGNAVFEVFGDGYGSVDVINRFFDVRFDPASFNGKPKATFSDPDVASETLSQKRPLAENLLKDWAALFNEAYPGAPEAQAKRSLEGMFPDKSVARERLRRVLPERQRGRPLKTND